MIHEAQSSIRAHVLETPLLYSPALSGRCGCRVYLKMECWQTCGCFKLRGVTNYLHHHRKAVMESGVVTASIVQWRVRKMLEGLFGGPAQ